LKYNISLFYILFLDFSENANKNMDDIYHIQQIPFIFEEVNSKGHLLIKSTSMGANGIQ